MVFVHTVPFSHQTQKFGDLRPKAQAQIVSWPQEELMERACMLKQFLSCVGRKKREERGGGMVKYEGRLQRKGVPGEEEADAWKTQASLPAMLCF